MDRVQIQGDGVPLLADPHFQEPGHDPYRRNPTAKDIRRIVNGPDGDFAIGLHCRYDARDG
ncbi:MAG: hypothetical protein ACRD9L_19480 [Bryobacteraceae bacterium]